MVFDFLQPYYYRIEKTVASRSIPAVAEIQNRQTLDKVAKDNKKQGGTTFDHSLWNNVLQRHVVTDSTVGDISGCNVVKYNALAADKDYAAYMEKLATAQVDELKPTEQFVFWINAYNAACVQVVVKGLADNPNLASITALSDNAGGGPVWDKPAATIAGAQVSLNHIEHEQLRGKWDEAAVHACIVCASASCPNLRTTAYTADSIQTQMDEQWKEWMSNESKGLKVNGGSKRVELSRIFLWFAEDFGGSTDKVKNYIVPHVGATERETLEGRCAVRYFDYDWKMNRAPEEQAKK